MFLYLVMRVFSETRFSRLSRKSYVYFPICGTELSICVRGHRQDTVEDMS